MFLDTISRAQMGDENRKRDAWQGKSKGLNERK
jgi:hypothetical protein